MKASVIVLCWDGMKDLRDCLDALKAQDFADFEVIVVDNGSTDGSADFVEAQYPDMLLIRNERNLGFAAGNNQGLRAAAGDVLVLLNQDTIVRPGWLAVLAEIIEAYPQCGIAGGKALYPDGRIQHAGGYVDAKGSGSHYGYQQMDEGQFDQVREVDYITGATLAISRQAYEAIGELDEGFAPAYFEDVDWCFRAREAGFRVVYAPQAVLMHRESSAGFDTSHASLYDFHRNRLRLVLKHWPSERLWEEFVPAEQAWFEEMAEGGEHLIAAVHHACLYHLLHLDEIVAWRACTLGAVVGEADVLARALLTLRASIPLRLARKGQGEEDSGGPRYGPWAEMLADLRQREAIQARPVRSAMPVVGPLLTAFRRPWNQAVTAAYVLPMIQQQIEFNTRVVTLLEQLIQGRLSEFGRLDTILLEYLREAAREIGELAQETRRLRALLEENPPDA
jgi:GT2 family glycosyltransferase